MDYQGCIFLEQGINFDLDTVTDCCILHNDNRGLPILIKNYNGSLIDWEELFNKKAERIKQQMKKTIYDCENCYHLGNFEFSGLRKISEFHFSCCRLCNAKCIYCSKEYSEGSLNYDTYPVIKDLIERGFYKSGGEATFQGGEPSIMPHFDELISLFVENGTKVRIHTSAIKFSPAVYEALKKKMCTVVISLDSGCRETYKKIKQIDRFENVISSIQKYSSADFESLIIKYIIIPGVNDNIEEIDKFFYLIKKYNIRQTALDVEFQYARRHEYKYVSGHIYLLTDYFEHQAAKYNIKVLTYSFLLYVLKNRKSKKSGLISFKPLYKLFVNMKNDKTKNINYTR